MRGFPARGGYAGRSSGGSPSLDDGDPLQRSTKKVKTRQEDEGQVIVDAEMELKETTLSYKDTLLNCSGDEWEGNEDDEDDDYVMPEEKWYKDDEEEMREFNPCPEIHVSEEEFASWCKPWRKALVVRLPGLTVSLGVMQTRLNKLWAIRGSIQIV